MQTTITILWATLIAGISGTSGLSDQRYDGIVPLETCTAPSGTFLPIADSCTDYYICLNGELVRFTCGDGYYFYAERGYCKQIDDDYVCNPQTTTAEPTTEPAYTCESEPNGSSIPTAGVCYQYQLCIDGESIPLQCPEGQRFSTQLRYCVEDTDGLCWGSSSTTTDDPTTSTGDETTTDESTTEESTTDESTTTEESTTEESTTEESTTEESTTEESTTEESTTEGSTTEESTTEESTTEESTTEESTTEESTTEESTTEEPTTEESTTEESTTEESTTEESTTEESTTEESTTEESTTEESTTEESTTEESTTEESTTEESTTEESTTEESTTEESTTEESTTEESTTEESTTEESTTEESTTEESTTEESTTEESTTEESTTEESTTEESTTEESTTEESTTEKSTTEESTTEESTTEESTTEESTTEEPTTPTTPTTTTPTTTTPSDNVCEDIAIGILPHPDCTKYYYCFNYQTSVQDCGAGEYFDPSASGCVADVNGVCLGRCANAATGTRFPDDDNCQLYFECQAGQEYSISCAQGYYFDGATLECVEDVNKICGSTSPSVCQGQTDGTIVPHGECGSYYVCNNNEAEVENCLSGYRFDVDQMECVVDPTFSCFCELNPQAVIPGDTCYEYYECANGEISIQNCPQGEYFDPTELSCVTDENETCLLPTTTTVASP